MIPVFRAVPPTPAQLAADPATPHTIFVSLEPTALALLTSTAGTGIDLTGPVAKITASRTDLQRLLVEAEAANHPLAAPLQRYLHPINAWQLRTRALPLDVPVIMGILNLTTDSFSGDGVGQSITSAVAHAETLRANGATIIDVGAETARADRPTLDEAEEAALVGPVIAALTREGHIVSSDTYKPLVARAALESGAEIINDISGLTLGTDAATEAARASSGYVLNYSYSVPKRRPDSPPVYTDVVTETVAWMEQRTAKLFALGLTPAQVAIDPGIAFGKSHDEDIQMLRRIGELQSLGLAVLLAHSRKNFIGSINGHPPTDRDLETHVASSLAFEQGVRIFRVHDPAGAKRALEIAAALTTAPSAAFAPDATSWPWRAGASATHMAREKPDKPAPQGQRW